MTKESTKDKVLSLLDTHKGTYYSGQELAEILNVSRQAVWKAINSLRDEGYEITGLAKHGYALAADTDVLSADSVFLYLDDHAKDFYRIECMEEVSSTNDMLKAVAPTQAGEGKVLIAGHQTNGRGRLGRNFYSPKGSGLYLSILLRPNLSVEESLLITTAAAVAASKACERVNESLDEASVKIKWVNDLFLNDRKIAGILTEANFSMEYNRLDYAVMGIGFNLEPPKDGYPDDIRNIAGSLYKEKAPIGSRNKLAAFFLNDFLDIYRALPDKSYIDEYRKRQLIMNSDVKVLNGDGSYRMAHVTGITDNCELTLVYEGETVESIVRSGEVSLLSDRS